MLSTLVELCRRKGVSKRQNGAAAKGRKRQRGKERDRMGEWRVHGKGDGKEGNQPWCVSYTRDS